MTVNDKHSNLQNYEININHNKLPLPLMGHSGKLLSYLENQNRVEVTLTDVTNSN
jgi:hypothetical protein